MCHEQVLEADLFVGLIGMRRGWEPPSDNSERRSITEMEYDWAKDHAPRFMYVAPDDFPVPGNLRETDEEHRRHLGFRQRIMNELVVSQDGFVSAENLPTPEVLAQRVVDALTNHVLSGDLIERIRPKRGPNPTSNLSDEIVERLLNILDKRGGLNTADKGVPFSTSFDVFVSYPHQDKPTAEATCSALEAAGVRCRIAPRDIAPGADWAASIVDAIDQCRVMVLIFSNSTNASRQIQREVQRAFDRGIPVIPLRIEDVAPANALAYYMGPVQWLDALTPPLERHLTHLTGAVTALLRAPRKTT